MADTNKPDSPEARPTTSSHDSNGAVTTEPLTGDNAEPLPTETSGPWRRLPLTN